MPFGGKRKIRRRGGKNKMSRTGGGGGRRRRNTGGETVGAQLAGLKTGRGMGGMGGRMKRNVAPAGKRKNRRRRGSSMR